MRLTLRTLLAFVDGVLDSQEKEQLRSRIKDSALANSIVDRIQQGSTRRQLAAPPPDGKGLGGDPNSVAEYLDNTLPFDRLPEFERVCLESDVQLMEVAACHQILKRALGHQVHVTNDLRQRMHALTEADARDARNRPATVRNVAGGYVRMDESHAALERQQVIASSRVARQPETIAERGINLEDDRIAERVPEYLRARTGGRWRSVLLTVGLLLLLPLVAWQAFGSWESIRHLLSGNSISRAERKLPNGREAGEEQKNQSKDTGDPAIHEESSPRELPSRAGESNGKASKEVPTSEAGKDVASEVETDGDLENVDPGQSVGANADSANSAIGIAPSVNPVVRWLPSSKSARESVVLDRSERERILSTRILASGDSVPAGHSILIPPAYQTEIVLSPSIIWTSMSTTDVDLLPPVDHVAQIRVHQSKALIKFSDKDSSIELHLGGAHSMRIKAGQSNASIGWESRFFHEPGADGRVVGSTARVAQLIGVEGSVHCQLMDGHQPLGSPVVVEVGNVLAWTSGKQPITYKLPEIPWWLRTAYQRPIERVAAEDMHRILLTTDPQQLLPTLQGLLNYRRPETAALAARILAALGDLDSLMGPSNVFENPRLRAHWTPILDELKASLAVDPKRWSQLEAALDRMEPSKKESRLRLLNGYSDEQLMAGSGREIYEMLTSSILMDRVLAVQNVRAIFGSDFGYTADRPSSESLQVLRKALGDEQLAYRVKPTAIPEATVVP